jgi:hypothetical protein
MTSIVRRGDELRRVVRQRRRMRWFLLVVMAVNVALFAAMVGRRPDGLLIVALCAVSLALLVNLATFIPRLELRALRSEITRPPLTRAQGRRWAYGGLIVGALVVVAALIVGALTSAWITALAVAAASTLMSVIWALSVLWSTRAGPLER